MLSIPSKEEETGDEQGGPLSILKKMFASFISLWPKPNTVCVPSSKKCQFFGHCKYCPSSK